MAADPVVTALLAWLGTYAVHSTLLLAGAWALTRIVTSSRRLADAAPAVRETIWRVALLAPLLTASVQRGLEVDPPSVLWTLETAVAEPVPALTAEDGPARALAGRARTAPQPGTRSTRTAQPSGEPVRTPVTVPFVPVFVPLASTLLTLPARPEPGDRRGERSTDVAAALPPPTGAARTLEPGAELVAPIAEQSGAAAAGLDAASGATGFPWARALLALWLFGIAAGIVAWAREWIALRRRLVGRVTIDHGPVARLFAELCERSGTAGVRLTSAPALATPISLGILRSEIVIPPRANAHLSPDELEALFAHELAHVRRGDPLWLVIYRAIQVVFFFQPLNRVARVRLHDEAELLADDWAATQVPSRVSLASCLTEIAGWIVDERRMLPAPAMAARGTRLSVRVRRLLDEQHHPERARRPNGLLLLAGLAVTGVALFGPGVAAARPAATETELGLASDPDAPSPTAPPAEALPVVVVLTPDTPVVVLTPANPELTATAVSSPATPTVIDPGCVPQEPEDEPDAGATPFEALAETWAARTTVPVTFSPSGELALLALEIEALGREADRRCTPPELRAELDALQADLATLQVQAGELERLLRAAIQTGTPVRLGP